jgi:putative ABC transport system permease protein
MEMWESLAMGIKALMVHKLRTFLTTLGIIIGVTTIIVIFTVINGLDKAMMSEISSLGSDVLFIQKYPWFAGMDWFKYRNRKKLFNTYYQESFQEPMTPGLNLAKARL